MTYKEIFEYTSSVTKQDNTVIISPSQIDKFFSFPSAWFKEVILGEPPSIEESTGQRLGTLMHYIYERYINDDVIPVEGEFKSVLQEETNPLIDTLDIATHYMGLFDITKDYLDSIKTLNVEKETEAALSHQYNPYVVVGGRADLVYGSTLVDFKNVGTKPRTDGIPFKFLIQMLAYARLWNLSHSTKIDTLELSLSVKPTKTIPARHFVVRKIISEEDWTLVDNTLELMARSIRQCIGQPELVPLIFKSMKLKGKRIPIEIIAPSRYT